MKAYLLVLASLFFLSCSYVGNATVYYVNITQPDNLGNGLSWMTAKKDIQEAINIANPGDSVWIAAGTYLPTDYPPTPTNPLSTRHKTFFVKDGVKIFGGFSGNETNFAQRNIVLNITILTGDLAGNDALTGAGSTLVITGNTENVYHVVLAVAPIAGGIGVTIDGFKIVSGNSNTNNIIVVNGVNVSAFNGAAICLYNGMNNVLNNHIYGNASQSGRASIDCVNGQNLVTNNTIENNYSLGVIAVSSTINYNTIKGNFRTGVWGDSLTISNNTIIYNGNSNLLEGGGMELQHSYISNNLIKGNMSVKGGGIFCQGSTIQSNIIDSNMAEEGGGIYLNSNVTNFVNDNNITRNAVYNAGAYGGGIYSKGNNIFNRNFIANNTANAPTFIAKGGGVFVYNGTDTFNNNVFFGNIASGNPGNALGGGMHIEYSGTYVLNNNTFYKNTAQYGGGIYGSTVIGDVFINNTIFWANVSTSDVNEDFKLYTNNTFKNCLLQHVIGDYTFVGNGGHDLGIFASDNIYATSPKFVDSVNVAGADNTYKTSDDGLRLKSISPCLNSGLNNVDIPVDDILGLLRPQGAGIDMGAYEKIFCTAVVNPVNTTPAANLNICNGFATTLTINSPQLADSVFWYADSTTNIVLGTGYNFTTNVLASTDTFWVSAHNCDSSSARVPIIVNVNPVITITATPNDSICAGASLVLTASGASMYVWSGGIINGVSFVPLASGTYTVVATDINGCSVTGTQAITLKQPSSNTITQTACVSYTLNGQTYNTSGTYTQTLVNAAGCDSVITLNLTINQPTANTINQTACTSYTLNGQTYNTSGTYTQTLVNAVNCDSVITLNLTINQPSTNTITQTACNSYTLNGQTYNTTGTYTQTLVNAVNCDSVITLNLTINTVNTAITQAGPLLTATATPAAYQWLRCNPYQALPGETNQTFTATANGDYAVEVTQNGCTDTSICFTVSGIGINDYLQASNILLYPNPVTQKLVIENEKVFQHANIKILTAAGQVVLEQNNISEKKITVDMSKLVSGIYFVELEDDGYRFVRVITKE